MSLASLYDLKRLQPVFDTSSFDDKPLIELLDVSALQIVKRLARRYPTPITEYSTGAIEFSGNAAEDDTVTLGLTVYRFKATPEDPYDIDIGADATASALNLANAINESIYNTAYYDQTAINPFAGASADSGVITLKARKGGPGGDDIPLSTTGANIDITAFSGGAREFPMLVLLNTQMCKLLALGGQQNSNIGTGSASAADVAEQIKAAWEDLEASGGYLVDTTGTTFASSSFILQEDAIEDPDDGMIFDAE